MSNLNIILNAFEQLLSKSGNNYRYKHYYADMHNKLNNIEHCRYYDGNINYIYVETFIDVSPILVIGLSNRKDFLFPNVFTHEGITYKVEVVRPVKY